MDLFIGFSKRKFYEDITVFAELDLLVLNQDDQVPLYVYVSESAAKKDMTGWTCSAGFVGTPGKPTGTAGGPALAALTASLTYDATNMRFTGMLVCNTDVTAQLIGTVDYASSVFAVRLTLPNADPTLVQRIQPLVNCRVNAAVIEDTSAGGLSLTRSTPVGLTVAIGQVNSAPAVIVPGIKRADRLKQLLPGDGTEAPQVKRWIVTENPDNANLNTLECELASAPAAAITIYAEIIANG